MYSDYPRVVAKCRPTSGHKDEKFALYIEVTRLNLGKDCSGHVRTLPMPYVLTIRGQGDSWAGRHAVTTNHASREPRPSLLDLRPAATGMPRWAAILRPPILPR